MTYSILRRTSISTLILAVLFSFSTTAFAQPAASSLSTPEATAVNQPHKRMFSWTSSSEASSYRLQIADNPSFSNPVYDRSDLATTSQFVDNLALGTSYYWRVAATNGAGTSAFSDVAEFSTWSSVASGPATVELGLLSTFAIIAHTAITNVPTSAITGDIGVSPAAGSFIFLSDAEVNGNMYTVDATGPVGSIPAAAMLTIAKGDLTIAYNDAAGRTQDHVIIAGNIGGQTLFPGLYKAITTIEISAGDLTLDANGNEDAIWIFQIGTGFHMSVDRAILLINGAKARNVFWQVGTAATFGTGADIKGTIMAGTQVTLATGATLEGRAMALTVNVTLQQNIILLPEAKIGTGIADENHASPEGIRLSQNYPNPFNPSTTIRFELDNTSDVRIEVFTLLGSRVAVLVDEPMQAGWHTLAFDGTNLTSGVYLYRLTSNGTQTQRFMTLVK